MDPISLGFANRLAGAAGDAAGIEFGPGPFAFEVIASCLLAFGGALREGAPWWRSVEAAPGDRFELSPPRDGMWSYVALAGGVDSDIAFGSRSTNLREGIGRWIQPGDEIAPSSEHSDPIDSVDPPAMKGPIRIFGDLPGDWSVGTRLDRMGYELEGSRLRPGTPDEWSEPVLPGCVQVYPSGIPVVLMPEGSTVGGYKVAAVVHSEDLRLVAQTPIGQAVRFVRAE